jgi:hypothetical protein
VLVFIAGVVAALLPSLTGMDMMRNGYGLTCLAGFVAMVALIAALVFFSRAAAWGKLARGQDVLAHWTYGDAEWQAYAQLEFEEESTDKRNLWLVLAGIALLVGAIFFLADREAGGVVLLVMLGLVAVTGALAFGLPRLALARNQGAPGEVVISSEAVWLSGTFHTWKGWGARLESVRLREETPAILEIIYSTPNRTGRQNTTVRVSVPMGQQMAARQVADQLQKSGR